MYDICLKAILLYKLCFHLAKVNTLIRSGFLSLHKDQCHPHCRQHSFCSVSVKSSVKLPTEYTWCILLLFTRLYIVDALNSWPKYSSFPCLFFSIYSLIQSKLSLTVQESKLMPLTLLLLLWFRFTYSMV